MKMNYMNNLIVKSPWPIMVTIMMMVTLMNLSMSSMKNIFMMFWNMFLLMNSLNLWMKNSNQEVSLLGFKNNFVFMSFKWTISLIILSEMMFFSSLFYINFSMMFFNNMMFNFKFFLSMFKLNFILSFLNLIILLTSSMTMMISLMANNTKKMKSIEFMLITIILGTYFVMIQILEFKFLNFNMSNSIFFSNFFMLTLFHMMHVIMGIMMMISLMNNKMIYLWSNNMKMKLLCWYWHFIDTIWVMIFLFIYI